MPAVKHTSVVLDRWEPYAKNRARCRFFQSQFAAVSLDEPGGQRQAKPRALTSRRVERTEDVRTCLFWNARTVVAHEDGYPTRLGLRVDAHQHTTRSRLARVADQVRQHQPKLRRIDPCPERVVDVETDVRGRRELQPADGLGQHLPQGHELAARWAI